MTARVEYVRVRHLPAREHTHTAGLYPPANVPAGKKIIPVPAPGGYPRVSGLPVPAKRPVPAVPLGAG
jgi:hypothetical protein